MIRIFITLTLRVMLSDWYIDYCVHTFKLNLFSPCAIIMCILKELHNTKV
jgi:hypothetical protein